MSDQAPMEQTAVVPISLGWFAVIALVVLLFAAVAIWHQRIERSQARRDRAFARRHRLGRLP